MKSHIGDLATGVLKSYGRSVEFGNGGRDLGAYALVHLIEGHGYYEDVICGRKRVEAHDVIVLFPGIAHSYGCEFPEDKWIEQFVVFDGPVFRSLEEEGLLDRSRPIVKLQSDSKWASDFYSFIMDHRKGKGVTRPELSVTDLLQLLVRLLRQRPKEHSWVEEAVRKLGEHLDGNMDLNKLATDLKMGEQSFRKQFKASTGYSPYQYRLSRRLEWGRDLLLKGRDKLEVVSQKCGFCDHYHFSRQFKKAFGLSPGAYRRSQGILARGRE